MRRHQRLIAFAATTALVAQVLAMVPFAGAGEALALPDPPGRPTLGSDRLEDAERPPTAESFSDGENHVKPLPAEDVDRLQQMGYSVLENKDGRVDIEARKDGNRTRIAFFETHTRSLVPVVGIAFADEAAIQKHESDTREMGRVELGPQEAQANIASWDHYHVLGPPFSYPCSFLLQYAGGKDAVVHVCSQDADKIKFVGDAFAAAIAVVSGGVPGLIGWLVWNIGWLAFQRQDGSIEIYVPGSSSIASYGNVYHYSTYASRQGWYYYYPRTGHQYSCYARKNTTGIFYYACPT